MLINLSVDNCKVRLQIWDTAGQGMLMRVQLDSVPILHGGCRRCFHGDSKPFRFCGSPILEILTVFPLRTFPSQPSPWWLGHHIAICIYVFTDALCFSCIYSGFINCFPTTERFRSMAPMYYRGAHAAILVYDITQEQSFLDMNSWVEELKKNLTDSLVIHVVGNKSDLSSTHRAVSLKQAQEYVARTLGSETPVHEVSAKDDNGTIEELFLQITRTLVERKRDSGKREPGITIQPQQPAPPSGCCS
ncbi:hypothetical protein BC936DRAFT_147168 [Jimgerdemannia flammicorona]|uniref:P-loop containing nucleoside triphosphate hydrolase protein n=1 Tax=Jimgerdemannia flammicorona TaxID=994334 RepID=A0A433D5X1_9FUNG|nr:hypothetical protein BC936DRAFT_147168 [Jimgerdemannia flammicorona]